MLYIFCGPDSFSRREALQKLKAELNADGVLETNTVVLRAGDATLAEVMAACDTAPFLGSIRLVIVEGLLRTQRGQARRGKKSAATEEAPTSWSTLVDYVDRKPATTVLVLVDGEVLGGDLFTGLRPRATVANFPALKDAQLRTWVLQRELSGGVKIDSRAAYLLVQLTCAQERNRGDDFNETWTLASELEKLALYVGHGGTIREEDVRELTSAAREQKGWALTDAMADGKALPAIRILRELEVQGEPLQRALATIAGRYRRLAIAREMLDGGAGEQVIGQRLGLTGFALERLVDQASRQSMAGLRASFARIVRADLDHKSGMYDEDVAMALLVYDLAAASGNRRAA